MTDENLICPHCGEENLPNATRCLYCGMPLEQAFSVDGVSKDSDPIVRSIKQNDENDLSDFLHELREESKSTTQPAPVSLNSQNSKKGQPQNSSTPQDKKPEEQEIERDENIPDWLERVRMRAKQETDASGDYAKKVLDRDELLKSSTHAEIDSEFDSWIAQVRDQARRDALQPQGTLSEETPEDENGIPLWLKKLREIETAPSEKLEKEDSKSENQDILPEWIDAESEATEVEEEQQLEEKGIVVDETTHPLELPESEQPSEVVEEMSQPEKPEAERKTEKLQDEMLVLVGELGVEAAAIPGIEELSESEIEPAFEDPYHFVQRNQRERMELLKAMLDGEGKTSYVKKSPRKVKTKIFRLVLALILLIMTIIPFFGRVETLYLQGSMHPASEAFFNSLQELEEGSRILMVLDYQPSTSKEMELLAVPVLQHLAQSESEIFPLAVHPDGLWLAENLFGAAELPAENGITLNTLEYIPGGKLGLLNMAVNGFDLFSPGSARYFVKGGVTSLEEFDRIIILVDSLQSGRTWMEQVNPYIADASVLLVSSAQEATILLPYFDSGQLDGLLSGYHEVGLYASMIGSGLGSSASWRAYQSGMMVMLILFVIGFIFRLEAESESEETKEK